MKFLNSLSNGLKKLGPGTNGAGVTGHKLGILPYLAVAAVVIIYFLFKGGAWLITNFGSYILIVGLVLLALFLIWKFIPSAKIKRIPRWIRWVIALVILYFTWPYVWQHYIKPHIRTSNSSYTTAPNDGHENDYSDIPTITYGLGQRMKANTWYKYRCMDDNGNHLNLYVTPQLSNTYVESKRLDVDGIWGELKINQDDVADITKNP